MNSLFINSVAININGVSDFKELQEITDFEKFFAQNITPQTATGFKRKRLSKSTILAFDVMHKCLENSNVLPNEVETIFASSSGEVETINELLFAISEKEKFISPAKFSNSVYNTPSGHWSILNKSHQASTTLACYDWVFAASLIKASISIYNKPILIVIYDLPYPFPLKQKRDFICPAALAILCSKNKIANSLAEINLNISNEKNLSVTLAKSNIGKILWHKHPIAKSLPFLENLFFTEAQREAKKEIILEYYENSFLQLNFK